MKTKVAISKSSLKALQESVKELENEYDIGYFAQERDSYYEVEIKYETPESLFALGQLTGLKSMKIV